MSAASELLLHGVFTRLRAAGLPLSVRDYLSALDALSLYPEPFIALSGVQAASDDEADARAAVVAHRVRERNELVWLCQTLWARTPAERRTVRDVITLEIGPPPANRALALYDLLANPHKEGAQDTPEPAPTTPELERQTEAKQQAADRSRRRQPPPSEDSQETQPKQPEDSSGAGTTKTEAAGSDSATAPVAIGDQASDDDEAQRAFPVPHLDITPPATGEHFMLSERPIVSPLWLTSLWRRLFVPVLREDRVEVDVTATVQLAARRGRMLRPVMKSRRVNTARLLVLIDVSDAMTPWRSFSQTIRDTLQTHASRLGATTIAHFSGGPGASVYKHPALRERIPTAKLLADCAGQPLLIFGEAGATGRPATHMAQRLKTFFAQLPEAGIRPVVWINPMPRDRWYLGAIDAIPRGPHVHVLELNAETLLRAVDLLRGVEG